MPNKLLFPAHHLINDRDHNRFRKDKSKEFILWFGEVGIADVGSVGGKNSSLGEMYQNLASKGVSVPNGFATTAYAYRYFLEKSGLKNKIKKILTGLNTKDIKDLQRRGAAVRKAILAAEFPDDFKKKIIEAYYQLGAKYGSHHADVAVRTSATAEDLADASFAGAGESYLNIVGEKALLKALKDCISSLFTNRSISYRADKGFNQLEIAMSVGIQKMVRSDLAASGVMFSCDPDSGFADVTVINAAYGLGENVVKGRVNPDEYWVFEPFLKENKASIIEKTMGSKEWRLVYSKKKPSRGRSAEGWASTKNTKVGLKDQNKFVLTDAEIIQLAKWSVLIETHYKRPMDIEWAKDGRNNKLFIVQARPETAHQSKRNVNVLEVYKLTVPKSGAQVLSTGVSVGAKIGVGKANVIKSVKQINDFKQGQVLVTKMTDPDWEPIMKIASAIVTDAGGRTCHAAIVSRELGIPAVVGTKNGTTTIRNNSAVTVDCSQGEVGYVYKGILPAKVEKTDLDAIPELPVKVLINLGEPDQAFKYSFLPQSGIGLAREEFIINNYIKIHPLALIEYQRKRSKFSSGGLAEGGENIERRSAKQTQKIKFDKNTIKQINELTVGYSDKVQFYIDKLAEGVGKLAAAFYPKEIIVRFSDFKTNEYANLVGGKYFEPKEENPMIGWRGASRYYDERFKEAFKLECRAIKKVRDIFGFKNVTVMIPFCRTVKEGKKVLEIMANEGLKRGENGFKVFVMAEIPANVILAEEFAKIFDGFSIGSNDLTQLALGLDRDNGTLAHIGNEKNEAVKILIRQLIKVAHKYNRKVGICGQAPSDFPDFAEFLVKEGIDSISLNPDTVLKTTMMLGKAAKTPKKSTI